MRYDLLDEARLALNCAGERVKTAERRYQIGALLVQLNELESATRHFEHILTMSEPERAVGKNTGLIGRATDSAIPEERPRPTHIGCVVPKSWCGKSNLRVKARRGGHGCQPILQMPKPVH